MNPQTTPTELSPMIWLVDDDPSIRWVLEKAIAREALQSRSFEHAEALLSALRRLPDEPDTPSPALILTDVRMSGMSGLELLGELQHRLPNVPVIVMTAYSDLDTAVATFKGGAFDYLAKPFDLDKVLTLIRRAVSVVTAAEEGSGDALDANSLPIQTSPAVQTEPEQPTLLGQSAAMQDVFRAIGRLSLSHMTVLITGETGTGKELVAQALHMSSPRKQKPFVAINTAAIPRDLLESELFGHDKGAFTGAQTVRRGRFEQAEGGTLFLDEIGDMPLELQTRLLRVLADGVFHRVGGQQSIQSNVRIIAATHQDLEARVQQGLFREDLLHRLNVIRLRLPPLRERVDDIPSLSQLFLHRCAQELQVEPKQFTDSALGFLKQFPFPGNVRQLENICRWVTVMCSARRVDQLDLPTDILPSSMKQQQPASPSNTTMPAFAGANPETTSPQGIDSNHWRLIAPQDSDCHQDWLPGLRQAVQTALAAGEPAVMDRFVVLIERELIQLALEHSQGRRVEAAQRLGIGRNTLTRKLAEWVRY